MNTPVRGFEPQEFQARVDKAQQLMQQQGLDLLLLNSEAEVRYFSGFLTQFWQSPTRPWFLLIPASGKPIAIIPEIGELIMRNTWLDDIRTWPSPQPEDEGISLITEAIHELCGERATIGLTKGQESVVRMALNDLDVLQHQLPQAQWHDCTPLIRELRMMKSATEIEKIHHICQIASDTFDSAAELFHVGLPLSEAFRRFKIAMLTNGADDIPYLVGGAGQGGYGDVISPPTATPLQSGDVLMLDTGSVFDGYYCDFDRNYAFGHASDAARRTYDTLYRATEAGLKTAIPGNTCSEIYQAMQAVIEKAGGGIGRMGHGLGMQLTEWPSHRLGDDTIIQENMVLTLEPSMEISSGKVMVHEENVVVRSNKTELLSRRAKAELPVL